MYKYWCEVSMRPSEVATALQTCIRAKQPAIVWGGPGIGKSQLSRQVAAALNRSVIDVRASLLDPVDLRGIPRVEDGRTVWCPPIFLPKPGAPDSLLVLDELNRAPVLTQNGLFQLVLDRALGEYQLPSNTEIIACCNREQDGGGVQRMPQALANRFVHLEMEPNLDDFCRFAISAGFEPAVIAFLRFRPDLLYKFSREERAFPTPRAWEFVSKITAAGPGASVEHQLYEGTVGSGAAVEYSAFLKLFRTLPNIDAILLNPASAAVPKDPATLFAVSSAIARRANDQTLGRVLTYAARLPEEYEVFTVKDALQRDQTLASLPDFTTWAVRHSDVVF